jgi:hypothetical protein
MKTKLLLTVLFSIGIIGITNAQGLAKNDRNPNRIETVKIQHNEPRREVRKPVHKINRHHRKAHRIVKRHHAVVRHEQKKHF